MESLAVSYDPKRDCWRAIWRDDAGKREDATGITFDALCEALELRGIDTTKLSET